MKYNLKKIAVALMVGTAALTSAQAKSTSKYTSYLFTYFTGNAPAQEQIRYALSDDGWTWNPLNNGNPVIASDSIALKKAVRDPHILRGEDGYFYQVVTDMASSQGWASNRGMVLLRSKNLINWEHHTVHFPEKYKGTNFAHVTRVWAPQTIYDASVGKYMVYYSLLTDDGSIPYDKVYYQYANADFSDLEGEPKVLYDTGDAAIDTDIVKDDNGDYHIFFKTENGRQKGIKQFIAKDLHNSKEWKLQPGFCQDTNEAVEGAGVFRLHDGSWCLMYDCYGAGHYQFCKSADLMTFKRVQDTKTTGAFTPRHGTVIAITAEEEALLKAWSDLSIEAEHLAKRSVPTLTLYQLENREAIIKEIKATLNGEASLKNYQAMQIRLKAFYTK